MARRTKIPSSNPSSSQPEVDEWKIRCVCGATSDEQFPNEAWIMCDDCNVWQHNACMGISIYEDEVPASFRCEKCNPDGHKKLLKDVSLGKQPWKQRRERYFPGTIHADKKTTSSASEQKNEKHDEFLPLTDKCSHPEHVGDLEWDFQKYWHQRYSIFSLYDSGIWMTEAAWFSTTPEPLANTVATELDSLVSLSKTTIIDLFGGVGGNAIAFARSNRWDKVIAVELDPSTVACGQRNAEIYGVADKITWINEDCFSYMKASATTIDKAKTVMFASPPWGGPAYTSVEIFDLDAMIPYSLDQILQICQGMDVAVFLPRNSDLRQIARATPEGTKAEVVQYCMKGASKGLVAYFPTEGTFPG